MEQLAEYIIAHADSAHWIIFGLLMLAGLNFPISEDLMIILSGTLASTVIPDKTIPLFIATFLGCYLSDWEAYWLGRLFGPKLTQIRLFGGIRKGRIKQISRFYSKYGFLTLLVGRFIPFGVRNCLFITAGMGKMPFLRFIIADGIACFTSNIALFTLAFCFGKNYHLLYKQVQTWNGYLFAFVATALLVGFAWYRWRRTTEATVGSL